MPDLTSIADQFVDQGFLVTPGLVSPDEVSEMRADTDRFASGYYPARNLPADGHILAVHFPHRVSPIAEAMAHHRGIVEVLSTITGAHLAHWDGRVKFMQSMLFVKPGGLPGQAWHQDERYIPTRDRSLVGVWIALDDATVDNGCLWVLPGSHRMGMIHPVRQHDEPNEYDPSDQAHGFDDSAAVPVEVKAGDVVFFNGYLLHKSLRNRTTGARRALVNHYMNAWSTLPWLVDQGIDVGLADNRSVIQIAGDDPYAWKGPPIESDDVFIRPALGTWGISPQ